MGRANPHTGGGGVAELPMTNTKIFLGGVPTEPDVTALNEAFPVSELLPGKFIEYSQISAVINVSPRSSRFKTVLDRWRKATEREHGIVTKCRQGEGIEVLDDKGKLTFAGDKLHSAARLARRSGQIAARVDISGLSGQERDALLKLERKNAAICSIAAGKRTLELPQL